MGRVNEDCRVLVVQNGARHDYAVPLALEKAGMLAGFYTDICGNEGFGKWLAGGADLPGVGHRLLRLRNRVVPEAVLPKTRSFPVAAAVDHAIGKVSGYRSKSPNLGRAMAAAGMCGANLIYSSLGWSSTFLTQARAKGVKVVSEFYVRPSHWRVHQEEYLRFPEWELEMPHPHFGDSKEARRGACGVSDFIIAPAPAVKEDLIRECDFPGEKIHVVPYGIKPSFFEVENRAVPGRVLFVGSCTLVKGIHCLARASQKVPQEAGGHAVSFQAAGGVTELIRQRPECARIEFLGRVPRHEITRLYAVADVLVFPTLSDSFGMVMLEAMAAGLPVISSPFCADVVQHGVSGFVVDPHDEAGLGAAITTVVSDRKLRERMAAAARVRAQEYLWDRHAAALTETLRNLA